MARNPERHFLSFNNSKVISDVENFLKLLKTRISSNDNLNLGKITDEYYKVGKC